ncbi:MAG TPA: response regulator [Terriglobales bacterium]|nr:response regulator [Terriglobales bacterium]
MAFKRPRTKILLVEGDATAQHLRALMLRMNGYEVETAGDLDEARGKLSSGKYHLAIVDVGHFAAPGLEFCEDMKQRHHGLKVLMQAEDGVFPLEHGCPDRVVPKQEGPHRFVTEVERVLGAA